MQQTFEEVEQPLSTLPHFNLTPSQEQAISQPTRKRVVSRRKYALRQVEVLLLHVSAFGLMGLAFLVAAWAALLSGLGMVWRVWEDYHPNHDSQWNLPLGQCALNFALFLAPVVVGACAFYGAGRLAKKRVIRLESDPLIPINTADLPAPDTLVRASLEPRQEQQLRHEVASTIVWPRMKR